MTQLDLIDVGERHRLEHYGRYGRKNPPCTADVIGSGPEGETCGTCLHAGTPFLTSKRYYKCGLMAHAWTHGGATDIKLRWPACSMWEPKDIAKLTPPGFPADALETQDGRLIAADWWEEHGDEKAAKRLRENVDV